MTDTTHPDTTTRLDTRRRGGRRGRRRWIIAGAAALAVLVGVLVWLVFFSSVLALRAVVVQGTSMLTEDEVLAQAQAPEGVPLARVSERDIAVRVAQLPAVDEVTVRRAWPTTLEIRVTERVPVFGLGTGQEVSLVDAEGAIFRGPPPQGLLEGSGPTDDPAVLAGAAAVVQALPQDLRVRAEQVTFTSVDAISVELSDNVEIFFGSADQAELKGEVALALVRGTNAKHIDVSAPTRPSTR